uniref:Uncharacterized protein n=1 Tax=Oryza sativa subsp. japonica TaxID=39947 RepID=Q7EYB9_ORYSJ|nr:hypothetical protein [Oryza sativa Japonica Group]BAD01437.1 hypothetical protein [Oryza sativa Japonica Group]
MAAAPDAAVVVPVLLPPPVPQVQPTLKDIVVEFPVDGGRGRLVAVLPLPPDHELRRSLDSVAEALASGRLAAVLPPARRNTVAAAGMAAQDVAARALGEGSRAYALAFEVSRVAVLLVFLPVFPFATLLHAVRLAVSDTDEPDEKPAPKSFAAAAREVLSDTICVGSIALMAFVLLVSLGALVKGDSAAKGSCREMIGSVIGDVGLVGFHVINLFVLTPNLALRVWRVKLPGHGHRVVPV